MFQLRQSQEAPYSNDREVLAEYLSKSDGYNDVTISKINDKTCDLYVVGRENNGEIEFEIRQAFRVYPITNYCRQGFNKTF